MGEHVPDEEASVLVEGAGLVNVGTADRPLVFTDPQSLSFGYLVAGGGANSKSISVAPADAGGGEGTWVAEVHPQVASAGATVAAAPVTLAPGGTAVMQITAQASAGAVQGDDFGFVVLRRGSDVRRIPYAFSVSRSSLTAATVTPLKTLQSGDTRSGDDRARAYRWPTSPFSILGIFGVDPSVNDDGKEKIYSLTITKQAVNAGVVVVKPAPKLDASITAQLSSNQPIHPWFMGSLDENDVLGYAGIPVNVNGSLPDFLYSIGASGGVFLPPGKYYVSVDSGRDLFTGRSLAGKYTLRSWVNDVKPPTVKILTKKLSSGRPTIVAKVADAKSGVDPPSMQLVFGPSKRQTTGEGDSVRPGDGHRSVRDPEEALPLEPGTQFMQLVVSDYQEAKNINTESQSPFPNTRFAGLRAEAVPRPTVTWITPEKGALRRRPAEAPRGRERQRPDLVGRLLRRAASDRPGAEEHRGALRADVAPRASARARTSSRRSRRTCVDARVRPCRRFASARDRGDTLRQAAPRGRHDRRGRGCEPVRQPLGRAPRDRVVGGAAATGSSSRRASGTGTTTSRAMRVGAGRT